MTGHRIALAAALVGPVLLCAAGPAWAHGAPTDPVSRVVACSPGGGRADSDACRAATAANGAPLAAWDDLRVAGVDGRDRQVVPDGRLCSGGLPGYRGLDLARADWPATRVAPGGTLSMTYASTIPHTGTFRLYLTGPGYDPGRPLTWSDLPERPLAEVTDPALTDGAYRFRVTLPEDRTGRHVLYTVWRNSSTPDTYYSCSDLVFPEREATEKTREASARGGRSSPRPDAKKRTAGGSSAPSAVDGTAVASASEPSGPSAPLLAGGAAALLTLTGCAALALRARRR
ncbi:lytic polysaccharide monooxygenase [Streptomyces sp. NPDC005931]|uniref:lytic polysaccharide monooxygenase auxiliary activity family 9 protein n=1 Tax=Streptomyces sp. NPDC005931 TaxID=3364737 RepID=UPI0036853821